MGKAAANAHSKQVGKNETTKRKSAEGHHCCFASAGVRQFPSVEGAAKGTGGHRRKSGSKKSRSMGRVYRSIRGGAAGGGSPAPLPGAGEKQFYRRSNPGGGGGTPFHPPHTPFYFRPGPPPLARS